MTAENGELPENGASRAACHNTFYDQMAISFPRQEVDA
jgi:hypothetical protein